MAKTLEDTFADFFGGSDKPECSYCGGTDGQLVVSVYSESNGKPTHHHHADCKAQADAKHAEEVAERERKQAERNYIARTDN